jgi:hypothetical protein
MTSFESLLVALSDADVAYAVVGGVACVLHGHVRTTDDVDVFVDPNEDNIARLLSVLRGWGEGFAGELAVTDFPVEPGAVRIIEHFPLDIFTTMAGLSWADIAPHVVRRGRAAVPCVDIHTLIQIKRGSLRPKDQNDVRVLRAIAARDG